MELNRDKLPMIYDRLKQNDTDMWIVCGRNSELRQEPVLPVLGDITFQDATALIFTKEKCLAVVSENDTEYYRTIQGIEEVRTYTVFEDALAAVVKEIAPKTIALDLDEDDASAAGLTAGMKIRIDKALQSAEFSGEVISAAAIIRSVRGRKTKSQIEKIRVCVKAADRFLRTVPEICYEDTTSMDLFRHLHEIAYKEGFGMSWGDSQCPSVFVDPRLPEGHGETVDTPLVKGACINIDYGVSKDGYVSDIQRMYYVLKDDETEPPAEVIHGFNVIRDAIRSAKEFMKPGVTGFQVDRIARHMVVDEGFDSWNAALGHQVGHVTHDGGTILANRRPRYNRPELIDTPLEEGNVFTLEPGLRITQGKVGLEEDVVITADGCEWIDCPQTEIIPIRLKKRG